MLNWLAKDIRDLPEAWFIIAVSWAGIIYLMDGEFSFIGAGLGVVWSYCMRRGALESRGRQAPMKMPARRR